MPTLALSSSYHTTGDEVPRNPRPWPGGGGVATWPSLWLPPSIPGRHPLPFWKPNLALDQHQSQAQAQAQAKSRGGGERVTTTQWQRFALMVGWFGFDYRRQIIRESNFPTLVPT